MTLAQEIILSGTKSNSMYERYTVRGRATVEDMRRYLDKESVASCIAKPMKPNAMKVQKFATYTFPNDLIVH